MENNNVSAESRKRRLMFSPYDDYLYLTYNIFLILKFYKCFSSAKVFRDHEKIVIAADILNNHIHFETVCLQGGILGPEHYHFCRQRWDLAERVIYMLKNRSIIESTEKGLFLKTSDSLALLDEKVFEALHGRMSTFKTTFPKFPTLSKETFVKRVYGNKVWE